MPQRAAVTLARGIPVRKSIAVCGLAVTLVTAGCSNEISASNKGAAPSAAPDVRSAQANKVVPIVNGKASIACGKSLDGEPIGRQEFAEFSDSLIVNTYARCRQFPEFLASTRELPRLRIAYQGEINASFAELIRLASEQGSAAGFGWNELSISSGGGDVQAAMDAGNAIADSGWQVWIPEGEKCMSACVLTLSAADMRIVLGEVGIHRVFPLGSTALTRDQLRNELRDIQEKVREYLTTHGVSATLADEMMTIPSSQIRVLTYDELDEFGLGTENAASEDLRRIAFIQQCGLDFVERIESVNREKTRRCIPGSRTLKSFSERREAYRNCYRSLLSENGLPSDLDLEYAGQEHPDTCKVRAEGKR